MDHPPVLVFALLMKTPSLILLIIKKLMIFVEEKPYPEASVKAECQETEGDSQECASEMRTGSN